MKNLVQFLQIYYPILIAFIAMMYSIVLGLTGDFESAQYSAHWPGTILLFAIALRQRRSDFFNNKR
ncbi:MAG: hypothetical protein ACKVJ6_06530 [Flavobacteriales bacterium]|jgi:hypothetical protein|tara:strand:- start:218 stop:415 length:198 start_codon:yes stop_codon:yes gene_type:complete